MELKKIILISFMVATISIIYGWNGLSGAENLSIESRESELFDTHFDDGVPGMMSKDDFIYLEDYLNYLKEHPEISRNQNEIELASPGATIQVSAALKYTIKGLTTDTAVQNACIVGNELYIIQLDSKLEPTLDNPTGNNPNARVSRCLINETLKTATVTDYMTINNLGHSQTLEYIGTSATGAARFIVACKANTSYDNKWALQVGRLTYDANQTISYTELPRLAAIAYANKDNTQYGTAKRVDAAVSDDLTKLLIWMQNTSNNIQYSFYNLNTINSLFDQLENETTKYVNCYSSQVTAAFLGSCQQLYANAFLPNDSFQGIEVDNNLTLKISGGKEGDTPKIAYITGSINSSNSYICSWIFNANVINTTDFSGSDLEIEGLQLYNGCTNCVIRDTGYTRNTGKYRVYSINNYSFNNNNPNNDSDEKEDK